MDNFWLKKGLKMAALVALYIVFFGTFVMALWNWLMPDLFNLPMITFSQALGLFILLRILTGGFKVVGGMTGLGSDKDHFEDKKQMYDKWQNMTPEDREKLRQEWREKCRSRPIGFHKKEKDDEPEKPDMI